MHRNAIFCLVAAARAVGLPPERTQSVYSGLCKWVGLNAVAIQGVLPSIDREAVRYSLALLEEAVLPEFAAQAAQFADVLLAKLDTLPAPKEPDLPPPVAEEDDPEDLRVVILTAAQIRALLSRSDDEQVTATLRAALERDPRRMVPGDGRQPSPGDYGECYASGAIVEQRHLHRIVNDGKEVAYRSHDGHYYRCSIEQWQAWTSTALMLYGART